MSQQLVKIFQIVIPYNCWIGFQRDQAYKRHCRRNAKFGKETKPRDSARVNGVIRHV